MSLRIPLAVVVVGALFIGGAATGTTLALWHDQAQVNRGQLDSATIALTVNGSATATIGGSGLSNLALNNGSTPGTAQSVTATLVNASSSGAKNMKMQMHLDTVTTGNTNLGNGLEVAASTVATAAACPAPAGTFKPLSAYSTTPLTTTSLAPAGTRKLCVDVRVKGGAATSVQKQTGTLTFTFRGQQARS